MRCYLRLRRTVVAKAEQGSLFGGLHPIRDNPKLQRVKRPEKTGRVVTRYVIPQGFPAVKPDQPSLFKPLTSSAYEEYNKGAAREQRPEPRRKEAKMESETRTFKFPDGYELKLETHPVELSDDEKILAGTASVSKDGKKGQSAAIEWLRPLQANDRVAKRVVAAGGKISDYLTNRHGDDAFRAGNGVAEAVALMAAPIKAQHAARDARFKAERAVEAARDQALIDEAAQGLPALLAQVPKGAIQLDVKRERMIDMDYNTYWADGIKILPADVTIVGSVAATRPTALAPFWTETVAYTTPEVVAEIKAKRAAEAKAKADAKAAKEAKRAAAFEKAKETGEPVFLRGYSVPCNDPREECDIDNVSEYALPDGSVSSERTHTY